MVAKIKSGKSLKGALRYNEHKVSKGVAALIDAPGFHQDAADLSFFDKWIRLNDLAGRNQRVTTNTVHISLNFDPAEQLEQQKLVDIARDYMDGIGFGGQPYLVYQHRDAGHPHVHIVSTNIDPSGQRISLHNLGRSRSETTRKAIEQQYGLIQAESRKVVSKAERIKPLPIRYGQTDSKKAMTNLINEVCRTYQFTSLPELNAVLTGFNVLADRGAHASVMYAQNGLRYWLIDPNGNKLGVPIKASSIAGKPTLQTLEKHFRLNQALRKDHREDVRTRLDKAIRKSINMNDLKVNLQKDEVDLITRVNADGRLYGVTFVDHRRKVVFNGSDLGKSYSAANLINVMSFRPAAAQRNAGGTKFKMPDQLLAGTDAKVSSGSFLEYLLRPDNEPGLPPEGLRPKRKKKKRKHL